MYSSANLLRIRSGEKKNPCLEVAAELSANLQVVHSLVSAPRNHLRGTVVLTRVARRESRQLDAVPGDRVLVVLQRTRLQ